jgi:hypothetical protein
MASHAEKICCPFPTLRSVLWSQQIGASMSTARAAAGPGGQPTLKGYLIFATLGGFFDAPATTYVQSGDLQRLDNHSLARS